MNKPAVPGQIKPGNIDLSARPIVWNPDGSYSTVDSMSIGTDEGEVLIPTVVNGQHLKPKEAVSHYKNTGEHLGIFSDPDSATKYAIDLHEQEAARVKAQPGFSAGSDAYWSGRHAGDAGLVTGNGPASGQAAYEASTMAAQANPYAYDWGERSRKLRQALNAVRASNGLR